MKFLALLACLLLAGCADAPAGAPETAVTTSPKPAYDPLAPLDISTIEKSPCDAITPGQMASLGAPQEDARPGVTDPGAAVCFWHFALDLTPSLQGMLFSGPRYRSGLRAIYREREKGWYPIFQPFVVHGYPGVVYSVTKQPPAGVCFLVLGLQEEVTYDLHVALHQDASPLGDPCELGKKVAAFIVGNLQIHRK